MTFSSKTPSVAKIANLKNLIPLDETTTTPPRKEKRLPHAPTHTRRFAHLRFSLLDAGGGAVM